MSNYQLPYLSKTDREIAEKKIIPCALTPWKVINVIYEVMEQHLTINDPAKLGYSFTQRYTPNDANSTISLAINFDWKAEKIQKTPAIYITRGEVGVNGSLSIGQLTRIDVPESTEGRRNLMSVPITISSIATGIGFAEQFAEYIRYPFLYFSKQIQEEYCIQKLRVKSIGRPIPIKDMAKDTFNVDLDIIVDYSDDWDIHQEALKLKTLGFEMFTSETEPPLQNQ